MLYLRTNFDGDKSGAISKNYKNDESFSLYN